MVRRLSCVILALVVVAGYLFAHKTSSFNGLELAEKKGKILRKPAVYRDHYDLDCHVPAKSTDWIYVKGYPVLQSK